METTCSVSSQQKSSLCRRCGTCCLKGGPALHMADRQLVTSGKILLKHLYTIRKGEIVLDNVKNHLMSAPSDIIKIKSQPATSQCIFYETSQHACGIYSHRPLECRTLACWDPQPMEQLYATDRLTREDLISGIQGLWDLVMDHQTHCQPDHVQQLIHDIQNDQLETSVNTLRHLIRYDQQLRKVTCEKTGLDSEVMDFLLGRPLETIVRAQGLAIY